MAFLTHNLSNLFSAQLFRVLIALFGLSVLWMMASPAISCCYDPPEYNVISEQEQASQEDSLIETDSDSEVVQDVTEEALFKSNSVETSDQQDSLSSGISAQNFPLIKRFMADGQYLRARQIAEKKLTSRPFDYQLWTLLETIYGKIGLQNKTRIAANNAEVMNPRRRLPSQPSPQMSQQKQYVSKLLQAIGEYKAVE